MKPRKILLNIAIAMLVWQGLILPGLCCRLNAGPVINHECSAVVVEKECCRDMSGDMSCCQAGGKTCAVEPQKDKLTGSEQAGSSISQEQSLRSQNTITLLEGAFEHSASIIANFEAQDLIRPSKLYLLNRSLLI